MHITIGLAVLVSLVLGEAGLRAAAEAAEGDRLALTGTQVNVRSAPGLDGDILATINPGETIIEIDDREGWFYVKLPDRSMRGWIHAPLLEATATPPAAGEPAPTDAGNARAALAATSPLAGDPKAGEKVFYKCGSCHTTVPGVHAQGPSLYGVFGKRPASGGGFGYSDGLRAFAAEGHLWDEETLDRFIQRPPRVVPGTSMPFSGVRDPEDRRNLIAYLRQL